MPRIPIVKPYTQINTPADFPTLDLPTGVPILVVATTPKWEIGHDGTIPWKHRLDMQWFKHITTQGIQPTVIMGRKTYDSIGKPLSNRRNIVITQDIHSPLKEQPDITVVHSLGEALDQSKDATQFVIGGGEIYSLALIHTHNKPVFLYRSIIPYRHPVPMDTLFPTIPKTDPVLYYFRTNTEQMLVESYSQT